MYRCKEIIKTKKSGKRIIPILILLIIAVVISAGCLNQGTEIPEISSDEIPNEMNTAILDFAQDITNLNRVVSIDIYNLASKISSADTIADIENIALNYYAENPWISNVIYYSAADNKYIKVPSNTDEKIISSLPEPTEKQLVDGGGVVHYSAVFNPDKGYQELDAASVYDKEGNYLGYLMISYDFFSMINYHQLMLDKEKSYDKYVLFVVDENTGKILFSSIPEAINEVVTQDSPFYDGQVLILHQTEKYGAYKYTSRALYNYIDRTNTDKITVWEDVIAHKRTFKVYITQEINKPALIVKDVYKPNPDKVIDDAIDLYVYAVKNGKEAGIARINSGYYSSPIYIMNMEGKVLASPYEQEGLNYLNNRDVYGTRYTKSMVYTAAQGGGFVYYTYPVEPVIAADAAQFSGSYILSLDENSFIMGFFPLGTDLLEVNKDIKEDTVSISREIIIRYFENGLESVSNEISYECNSDAKYFRPDIESEIYDLAIMDYNGVVYASLTLPELIGDVLTGYTDVYGGSTIRKAIMLAKSGGGYMLDLIKSDTEGYNDLILLSVEPLSDDKFVITAVCIGTFEDLLKSHFEG